MDPLHPLREIRPTTASPPANPLPVQRIEREQRRDSPPNRERPPQDDPAGAREEPADDHRVPEDPGADGDDRPHIDITV